VAQAAAAGVSRPDNPVDATFRVAAHMSGKAIAKALEENLGWQNYKIVQDNAMVFEQAETQRLINQISEDVQTEATINPEGVDIPPEMM